MAKKIVFKLKQEEYRLNEIDSDVQGLKRCDVVEWYLKSYEEDGLIESEADLIKYKVLCEKVIDRLVKIDHILIALRESDKMEDDADHEDDCILIVHPNYSLE